MNDWRPDSPLTERQRQFAGMVLEGITVREMAERLGLSESTAKRHISNLMLRFGVENRVQLAVVLTEMRLQD